MLYLCTADITNCICAVLCVLAGSRHIIECEGIVSVVNKGKGNLSALRHEELIALVRKNFRVIKNRQIYVITLISVCHIEAFVVAVLNSYIAVFCEGSNKLSVLKLIGSDIFNILTEAILLAVYKTAEIERSSEL